MRDARQTECRTAGRTGRRPGHPVAAWQDETDRVNAIVLDAVARWQGLFSAGHGLGERKNPGLALDETALEAAARRKVKQALDPRELMNPGKLLPH